MSSCHVNYFIRIVKKNIVKVRELLYDRPIHRHGWFTIFLLILQYRSIITNSAYDILR